MLLNLTNHSAANWSEAQLEDAAARWGEVADFPFPDVEPEWDAARVAREAEGVLERVLACQADAVLCQGEMTMVFALVCRLQARGIPVYAACTRRESAETLRPDGSAVKTAVFRFAGFRPYPACPEGGRQD